MNKAITISLFRVSADGQFIDVVVDCPLGFQFDTFILTANYMLNGEEIEQEFNIGDELFKELLSVEGCNYKYGLSTKTHWVIRIPIEEQLGIPVPAVYTAVFAAKRAFDSMKGHTLAERLQWEADHPCEGMETPEFSQIFGDNVRLPEAKAICSDLSNVYQNIMDSLINSTSECVDIDDSVIRNYLIVYAHQEALRLGHISDAMIYFNLINKNFNRCGNFARSGSGPSCGIGGSNGCGCSSSKPKQVVRPTVSSCGCGK